MSLLAASLLLVSAAAPGKAQVPAEPVLEGQVIRAGSPLAGETVVLHRVAEERAGSVDSIRADPEGGFGFQLPAVPRDGEGPVYFASVRYQGVLYFGSAINRAAQLDSLYRIQVYDTTAAPAGGTSFPVSARNLLLEEVEDQRTVVDLIQIRNDGDRTVVGPEGRSVWTYPLPPEAENFEVGRSDLAPDAVSFEDGRIRVTAPVPPGERTYLVRYTLSDLSLTIPLPGTTEHFELLLREPAPQISVAGAAPAQPVEIEPGSNYRRFSASDLIDHEVAVTTGGEGGEVRVAWVAVILALVLAGAGIVAVRRDPRPAAAGAEGGGPSREELLLRIAELDEAHQRLDDPSPAMQDRYRKERSRLKARLRERD